MSDDNNKIIKFTPKDNKTKVTTTTTDEADAEDVQFPTLVDRVILGYNEDDRLTIITEVSDPSELLWMLNCAISRVVNIAEEEFSKDLDEDQ